MTTNAQPEMVVVGTLSPHEPGWLPEGTEVWYLNGERHREDGPAVITGQGEEWWIHGKLVNSTIEENDEHANDPDVILQAELDNLKPRRYVLDGAMQVARGLTEAGHPDHGARLIGAVEEMEETYDAIDRGDVTMDEYHQECVEQVREIQDRALFDKLMDS